MLQKRKWKSGSCYVGDSNGRRFQRGFPASRRCHAMVIKGKKAHAAKSRRATESLDLDTRVSVSMACRDLGISEDLAVWSIIEYGERNQTFHGDLDSLKADGDFRQLALVLYTDLEDIDCVFSKIQSETDKHVLKSFIYDEIDRWF